MDDYLPVEMRFKNMVDDKIEKITNMMSKERAEEFKNTLKAIIETYELDSYKQLYEGLVKFEADEKKRKRIKYSILSYDRLFENALNRIRNSCSAEREFKEEFKELVW
ncbi:MAG: hypothetical protein QW041_03395 [Candidatus Pacearchaeota archaeon]